MCWLCDGMEKGCLISEQCERDNSVGRGVSVYDPEGFYTIFD